MKTVTAFFQSASFQMVDKNRPDCKNRNSVSSAEHDRSMDESESDEFTGAPQHWLKLIQRNNLSCSAFIMHSSRIPLPLTKMISSKKNNGNHKTTSPETTANLSKQYAQNSDRTTAYHLNKNFTVANTDPHVKNTKLRIQLKSAAQSSLAKDCAVVTDSNIPFAQHMFENATAKPENRTNTTADKKSYRIKNMRVDIEPTKLKKNTTDTQTQINIEDPVIEDTLETVTTGPADIASYIHNDHLRGLQKNKTNKTDHKHMNNIQNTTPKDKYSVKDDVISDSSTIYKNEPEMNLHSGQYLKNSTDFLSQETTPSLWQELPEDAWDEMNLENQLTRRRMPDGSDIRKILWNG